MEENTTLKCFRIINKREDQINVEEKMEQIERLLERNRQTLTKSANKR